MKTIKNPKVTLVGAGPGDPKLITLAGLEALQNTKVVLYDALVSKQTLKYAPDAKLVYVGKRKGNHKYTQDEINHIIVEMALTHKNVVRLKGGDPFIFGRGAEELKYIEAFGIETEVIPGVSSVTSVPARSGISLTKRGVSESFWVITGTTSKNQLSEDLKIAAQTTATVVLLMGMSKILEIVSTYKKLGKSDLPIAIIQNGFMPNENIGIGTIATIEEIIAEKSLSNPAIIIIGEVVNCNQDLSFLVKDIANFNI